MPVGKRITPMKKSPTKFVDPLTIMAIGSVVGSGIQAIGNYRSANRQLKAQEKARTRSGETFRENLQALQDIEISNPFANIQTQFENPFEDITVNQQAAQFASQQAAQSRANIMDQFRGAAGASGIAGLAQAMANQATLQNARAAASIGQQESRNQALMAQGAARVSAMEQQAEQRVAYGDYLKEQNENQRALNIMQLKAGRDAAKTQFDMNEELLKGQKTQAITGFVSDALSTAGTFAMAGGFNRKTPSPVDSSVGLGQTSNISFIPENYQLGDDLLSTPRVTTPLGGAQGVLASDFLIPDNPFNTSGLFNQSTLSNNMYQNLLNNALNNAVTATPQFNYADNYGENQLYQRRREMRDENNYDYRSGGEAAYIQNLINIAKGDPTRYDI